MPRRGNDDQTADRHLPGTWPLRVLSRAAADPLTTGGLLVMLVASSAIVSNALLMQSGRHPAPLFETRPFHGVAQDPVSGDMPPAARMEASPALVRDIQLALLQKNIYLGPVDGVSGRMTRQAIADFEKAAGLPVTGNPSAKLLARLQMTTIGTASQPQSESLPVEKPRANETPPASPAVDNDVARVQGALNRLGYGPLDVDGLMGAATAKAIRDFELNRGLPITGKISDRLIGVLVSIGGMPRQ